jgi:hypothetical protein
MLEDLELEIDMAIASFTNEECRTLILSMARRIKLVIDQDGKFTHNYTEFNALTGGVSALIPSLLSRHCHTLQVGTEEDDAEVVGGVGGDGDGSGSGDFRRQLLRSW